MRFYCLSLTEVEEYFTGKKRLSKYPLDPKLKHAIRQIVDLAMENLENEHLVIPALRDGFSIDALPTSLEDDLREFLKNCLTMSFTEMNVSYFNDKMNIFLK